MKTKRYWLFGLFIGFIVGLIVSVLTVLCISTSGEGGIACVYPLVPAILFDRFFFSFTNYFHISGEPSSFVIPNAILAAVAGAVIGWIYSKIENRIKFTI